MRISSAESIVYRKASPDVGKHWFGITCDGYRILYNATIREVSLYYKEVQHGILTLRQKTLVSIPPGQDPETVLKAYLERDEINHTIGEQNRLWFLENLSAAFRLLPYGSDEI